MARQRKGRGKGSDTGVTQGKGQGGGGGGRGKGAPQDSGKGRGGGGRGRGKGGGKGGGQGDGKGQSRDPGFGAGKGGKSGGSGACFTCGGEGHVARDCPVGGGKGKGGRYGKGGSKGCGKGKGKGSKGGKGGKGGNGGKGGKGGKGNGGGKLLVLLDMNGTLLHRTKSRPQHIRLAPDLALPRTADSPARCYYMRPQAQWFVQALMAMPRVRLAFCTSMFGRNAHPAVEYLAGRRWQEHGVLLLDRSFQKHDSQGKDKWDTMRDMEKVWAHLPRVCGWVHGETDTVFVDDSPRKMREHPENALIVPTFDDANLEAEHDAKEAQQASHTEACVLGRVLGSVIACVADMPMGGGGDVRTSVVRRQASSEAPLPPDVAEGVGLLAGAIAGLSLGEEGY